MTKPLSLYSPTLVCEFYVSYHATVYVNMHRSRGLLSHTKKPDLEKTLVRGVMVDILAVNLCQILFFPEYITPTSTVECDHILWVTHDRHIMRDTECRHKKVEMERWIGCYISPLGDETHLDQGEGNDKEGDNYFCCKVFVVDSYKFIAYDYFEHYINIRGRWSNC